jgi:heterodisulfide reductase subunit A-like polyferredoxin
MATENSVFGQSKTQAEMTEASIATNKNQDSLVRQPVHPLEEFERALDLNAIEAKYEKERDKRLHEDGVAQFRQTEGSLAHFKKDPWAVNLARDRIEKEIKILIVGGGFGGLVTAMNLTEQGLEDFILVEKGADFGGTWYWNQYPGTYSFLLSR